MQYVSAGSLGAHDFEEKRVNPRRDPRIQDYLDRFRERPGARRPTSAVDFRVGQAAARWVCQTGKRDVAMRCGVFIRVARRVLSTPPHVAMPTVARANT